LRTHRTSDPPKPTAHTRSQTRAVDFSLNFSLCLPLKALRFMHGSIRAWSSQAPSPFSPHPVPPTRNPFPPVSSLCAVCVPRPALPSRTGQQHHPRRCTGAARGGARHRARRDDRRSDAVHGGLAPALELGRALLLRLRIRVRVRVGVRVSEPSSASSMGVPSSLSPRKDMSPLQPSSRAWWG